jgi:small subunit ribosomal protein S6
MKENKRLYETTYIINGSLEDAQIESIISKVNDVVVKHGGEVLTTIRWGRKRFTYPIRHKTNGYYVILEIKTNASFIREFERFFHLEENILRYLCIALTKQMLKAKELKPFVIEPSTLIQQEVILEEILTTEIEEAKEEIPSPIRQELHPQENEVQGETNNA